MVRKRFADFIINGMLLIVEGGNVHFTANTIHCQECGRMFKTNFDDIVSECPACHSKNSLKLAEGYRHGKCYHSHQQKPYELSRLNVEDDIILNEELITKPCVYPGFLAEQDANVIIIGTNIL